MTETTSSPLTADAVVVGSGVIGAAIALELTRAGRSVLILDKAAGPGHGSTSASSAVIRFLYSTFDSTATAWEAGLMYAAWAEHLGLPDDSSLARFHRTGMLHLDVPALPREQGAELLRAAGVPFEDLPADELAARFPHLDTGAYWPNKPVSDDAFWEDSDARLGALHTPDAGYMDDPRLAADNLARAARACGAQAAYRAQVVSAEHRSGVWHLALADGRTVTAPVVVNAAGPWSGAFNRLAGVGEEFTVSVRPLRQEVHQVKRPAAWDGTDGPAPGVFDIDLGTYMRPGPAGAWVVGGTEPECDGFDWVEDPDAADMHVTNARYEAQVTRAARRLPELAVPNRPSGVVGVYDVADDWTPIYDRTDAPGFFVAMGTSGNQFKNAPLVGCFLATLVAAVEEGVDHDTTPVAYVGEHSGLKIDLGAFSRKRDVNAASTRTVLG
ncbi:FAD-dependent oxidoreductase [Marmoricola endophyticus]|uniref:FAD-dependent oxidoreductase n=1 Tax=Marmoricola endophyticus TaxID=2040280 RepID=A0A917F1I8_9ACTN|nr:FAD-dependent oxidoreductase [Marmoricola endophyticus]GGF35676.1 FAD-dependent oxidoreductase [Marmoricola endophyticus]